MTPTGGDHPGLLGRRHRPGRQPAERPRLDRRDPGHGRHAADPDVARPVRRVRRARRPRHPVGRRGGSGAERRGRGGVPRPRRPRRDLRGRSVARPGVPGGRDSGRRAGPGRAEPGRHPSAGRGRAAGLRTGDPVLASPSALLRNLRVPDPRRSRRAPQDVPERGVRAAAFPAGRTRGDHARGEPGQPRSACWPGTRVQPPARTRPWRASSGSARAWRTRCGARSPRRPACPSGR